MWSFEEQSEIGNRSGEEETKRKTFVGGCYYLVDGCVRCDIVGY